MKVCALGLFSVFMVETIQAELSGEEIAVFADRLDEFEKVRSKPLPDNFRPGVSPDPVSSEFDLGQYFKVFPHLHMREGMALDWVYEGNDSAGGPILYTRLADAVPFENVEAFRESIRERAHFDEVERIENLYREKLAELKGSEVPLIPFGAGGAPDPFGGAYTDEEILRQEKQNEIESLKKYLLDQLEDRDYWNYWREDVVCDGTDKGFLELAALYVNGSEFFLYFGALGSVHKIMADRKQMERALVTIPPGIFSDEYGLDGTDRDLRWGETEVRLLDPTPSVVKSGGKVQVRLLVFDEANGFARKVFTFTEDQPHEILDERVIVEVAYFVTRIF